MEAMIRICIPSLAGSKLWLGEYAVSFDASGIAEVRESYVGKIQQSYPEMTLCEDQPEPEPVTIPCDFPRCGDAATWKLYNPSLGSNGPIAHACDAHKERLIEEDDVCIRLPGAPPEPEVDKPVDEASKAEGSSDPAGGRAGQ
jgi:hypothetical protein